MLMGKALQPTNDCCSPWGLVAGMTAGFCTAVQAAARLQAETVLGACSSVGSQGVLSAWLPAHLPDLLSAMPSDGRGEP